MKKTGLAAALVLAMIVAGCGAKDVEGGQEANKTEQPPAVEASKDEPVKEEASEQVDKEVVEAKEESSVKEDAETSDEPELAIAVGEEIKSKEIDKMVLDHVMIFMSGNDEAAKIKHIEDNVHPDIAPLYNMSVSKTVDEADQYKNPKIVKTIAFEGSNDSYKNGTVTLVEADNDREVIIYTGDGKILVSHAKYNKSGEILEAFTNAKAHFE